MKKAMIITVGGTSAPIIETIKSSQPNYIIFIASEDTKDKTVPEILKSIDGKEISIEKLIVDNPNNLDDCFNKAREASRMLEDRGPGVNIIADPTGGTKLMTAGLSIVSARKGYEFSYVSGEKRNKDGIGTVISGYEKTRLFNNPYRSYAVLIKDNIINLINHGQHEAASRFINDNMRQISEGIKPIFSCVTKICKAYNLWDNWDHEQSLSIFNECKLKDIMVAAKRWGEYGIANFINETEESIEFLKQLHEKSYNRKKHVGTKIIPTEELILDLISNSRRRYREYKFDDAVIRLYKTIELKARMELLNEYGIDNSDVKLDDIPDEDLKKKIQENNFNEKEGKYKIGLLLSYKLLKSLNNKFGESFFSSDHSKHIMDIQQKRNQSWLIHSNKRMKENDFNRLLTYALDFLEVEESEIPEFPKLK